MGTRNSCAIRFRDPGVVAGTISEHNAGYGPGSAAYSPEFTPSDTVGRTLLVNQMDAPGVSNSDAPTIRMVRPPAPNVGGEPGRRDPLGYSIGLLPSRAMRQPFRGATLVRPSMGVHPATGPVGLSNRQGRLQAGVAALVDTYLPSTQQVREQFTQPAGRNANPIEGV